MPRRTSFDEAVLALDHDAPNWRTYVDPQRLEMQSPTRCVLGQIYGTYIRGYDALRLQGRRDVEDCFLLSMYLPYWIREINQPRPRKLSLWQRIKRRFV